MQNDYRVRQASLPPSDDAIATIAEIHWQAARIAYAYRNWRHSVAVVVNWYGGIAGRWDWLSIAYQAHKTAEGEAVGFAAGTGPFLDQLFVVPSEQGRGVGGLLLKDLQARAGRPIELHVLSGNAPARTFYERRDFKPILSWWDEGGNETVVLYRLD